MNERFDFTTMIEPQVFDRLVDGELSADDERALLTALEARPDGWRRCALAFLEARAWKNDLGALAGEHRAKINGTPVISHALKPCATGSASASMVPSVIGSQDIVPARRSAGQWTRVLTMAASIGLAFFLGIAVRGYWSESGALPDGGIAAVRDQQAVVASGVAAFGKEPPHYAASEDYYAAQQTITMSIIDSQGTVERQIEVPLVEADRLDPGWLAGRPAAMPQATVDALRRNGYRVEEQRWFVPVLLKDGRQAIVALDRAEVKYAGMQF